MKRFLSILLCSAILAAAIPGMYYAEGNQSSYDELSQLKEIDYQLNGGHYVSGYNAPDKYPAEQLPDKNERMILSIRGMSLGDGMIIKN